MLILFEILLIVSAALLLIGLTKPTMLRYFWLGKSGNKKYILIIYGFCVVLFSILTIVEKSHEKPKTSEGAKPKTIKKEIIKAEKKYSVLSVTSFVYKNENIEIRGKSDLPDDSKILISILPVGQNNKLKRFSRLFVKNGEFNFIFKVPQKQEWYTGAYKIEIKFSLDMQADDKVSRLIGNNGKNLTGKLVVLAPITHCKSLLYAVIKEIPALKLKSYPMPEPKDFIQGGPKYILACFLQGWKQKNWEGMVKYADEVWVNDKKNPEKTVESIFAGKTLIGAKILGIPIANDLLAEVRVKLFYLKGDSLNVIIKSKDVQLVKKDVDGGWGVFPPPLMGKNTTDKAEE